MSAAVKYLLNKASAAEIAEHLSRCDSYFVPPLSPRVEIRDYAKKIKDEATRFEAWSGDTLIGLVAAYNNDQEGSLAYITSVSVLPAWMGNGIAGLLVKQCVEHAKTSDARQISLEVASDNAAAIQLYRKSGFAAGKAKAQVIRMNLRLGRGEENE